MKADLELYIHIPFCERKCNYCDFLSFKADTATQSAYVSQLISELTAVSAECGNYSVSSVFVGGGTPSLLPGAAIESILEAVARHFSIKPDAEMTVECNPGSVIRHKLAAYKRAGVNRLSIGLQSADNAELKLLGRIHSFEEFLKTYQAARMEKYDNINVDLINCFPMQSMNTWKKTLRTVTMLKPEHISVYNMIIEPGTPFYEMQQEGVLLMPSEDEQSEIDSFTKEYMSRLGYRRYEFSNWCRPGHACRHNLGYWQGVPYIGLGLGASSYFNGCRWKNTSVMAEYMAADLSSVATSGSGDLRNPAANGSADTDSSHVNGAADAYQAMDRQAEQCASGQGQAADVSSDGLRGLRREYRELNRSEKMEEFMYLGLRCTDGVSEAVFNGRFGTRIEDVYGTQLARYVGMGLMEHDGGMYRLTDRGIDVSNVILSDFLLDSSGKA